MLKPPTSEELGEETRRGKAPYPVFITDENCPNLNYLIRVASLADPFVPTMMFVRSTVWGIIAQELAALPGEIWTDPTNLPTAGNFKSLQLTKNFVIVNAETDSQVMVDLKNVVEAEKSQVGNRIKRLGYREEKKVDERNLARDH